MWEQILHKETGELVSTLLNDYRLSSNFFKPQFSHPYRSVRALDLVSFCLKNSEYLIFKPVLKGNKWLSVLDCTHNLLESEIKDCGNNVVGCLKIKLLLKTYLNIQFISLDVWLCAV